MLALNSEILELFITATDKQNTFFEYFLYKNKSTPFLLGVLIFIYLILINSSLKDVLLDSFPFYYHKACFGEHLYDCFQEKIIVSHNTRLTDNSEIIFWYLKLDYILEMNKCFLTPGVYMRISLFSILLSSLGLTNPCNPANMLKYTYFTFIGHFLYFVNCLFVCINLFKAQCLDTNSLVDVHTIGLWLLANGPSSLPFQESKGTRLPQIHELRHSCVPWSSTPEYNFVIFILLEIIYFLRSEIWLSQSFMKYFPVICKWL